MLLAHLCKTKRKRLFLVAGDRKFINGKYQLYAPSDFLLEMQLKLSNTNNPINGWYLCKRF